ncbi:MAG: glycosyltransferase [Flavobacteriales bacterium]|nr:glycosyltransferase [Flavobacteriales bacterium]
MTAPSPWTLFLHLSSTEGGALVALQEAASFGIPLLAADVGGVGETVGPTTGILLPSEPSATQVATELDRFLPRPLCYERSLRLQVREQWS